MNPLPAIKDFPVIKGILFDFDGTLAKTMGDLLRAWQHSFRQYGVEIKEEDYFPLEGMEMIKIARTIAASYNLSLLEEEYSQIVQRKEQYYLEHHSFSFYPGVEELINKLSQRGMQMGLVTASSKQKLEKTVSAVFLQKFKVIISRELAGRGKPYPDPYLVGVKALGLKTEECIAIENAPLGVESAKKAGLYCIAIVSTVNKEKLWQADEVVKECKDILMSKNLSAYFSKPR